MNTKLIKFDGMNQSQAEEVDSLRALTSNISSMLSEMLGGISLDVAPVGGAIRDTVHGAITGIKDYDVIINIPKSIEDSLMEMMRDEMGEESFNKIAQKDFTNINTGTKDNYNCSIQPPKHALMNFIKTKLNQKISDKHEFHPGYLSTHYIGLVHLPYFHKGKGCDLIITDSGDGLDLKDRVGWYLGRCFDFDICKAFYHEGEIYGTEGFFDDISNKTITLTPTWMNIQQVEYSLESHLPRFNHKYPRHTLKNILYPHLSKDEQKYIIDFAEEYNTKMVHQLLSDGLHSGNKINRLKI